MTRPERGDREGMILLNTLVVVAIAAATVAVMISAQDIEVQRTIRLRDASQAQAYARAAELSAVVALRRDALTAPDIDAYSEPWAIGQRAITIPGGRFAMTVSDEQARFNINSLRSGDAASVAGFAQLASALSVSPATVYQITAVVAALGPLADAGVLQTAGVDPVELARLAPVVSFLPDDARLNLNTVDAGLLSAITGDPAAARAMQSLRTTRGFLTPEDVAGSGLAAVGGLTSNNFLVTSTIQVGDVSITTYSRLTRAARQNDVVVRVLGRRRSTN